MTHSHSLTRYLYYIILYYIILYYIILYFVHTYNLTKTNEISFNTHLLVIAYYVYMYSVIL